MKVTMLGTGTSFPDPDRVQSGVMVEADENVILFDIGSGVLHRLVQTGIDITRIEHLFISHFHVDHCSDFMTLIQSLWLSGYDKVLHVYAASYAKTWWQGLFEHSFEYMKDRIRIELIELDPDDAVSIGNVRITTSPTAHGDRDSRAFKVQYGSKTMVYTSDTGPDEKITRFAKEVDLLIHECNWLDGEHEKEVHTSPSELNDIVRASGAKTVVVTHVSPEVVEQADEVVKIVGR
ncbi:MBL fold metallo-hydrolase, partial [Candidatus Thorarchaeota archaeon]